MIAWRIIICLYVLFDATLPASSQTSTQPASDRLDGQITSFLQENCFACHADGVQEGGLSIDDLISRPFSHSGEQWETMVRKLATRRMPPLGQERPDEESYVEIISLLEEQLDRSASNQPNPGRTETFRRLNRTEYQNAIRDLLGLRIHVGDLLPADEASQGFDNITVANLSAMLLDRYISVAQKISRLTVGARTDPSAEINYRIRPDVTQDSHLPGTPIGTRGGMAVEHYFPQDGEYELQVWLMRDRNEELEGKPGSYQIEVSLERERKAVLEFERPAIGADDKFVDVNLTTRFHAPSGSHDLAVTFLNGQTSLLESVRQPLNVHYNYYRHPRIEPAVYQVTVRGPFDGQQSRETPSRQRLFVCYPKQESEQQACAEQILLTLMRRAYRREVSQADLDMPMNFFHEGRQHGGFDTGIERALGAVLVNPQFLLRIERDPEDATSGVAYQVSPLELASRLSFFLWSSIPDDELLDLAIEGRLHEPDVLTAQVKRMLADKRSASLVNNFADQWLYLRNLDSFVPEMRLFPDFDDNLRQAFRRETELFVESVIREDRSVLDLLDSDYTFLNERLAKHYGIPHIYGTRFRRVELDPQYHRGGLLRQGSILCVTSYATRTSPVKRGMWVLENLLGSPPPPPPPDVPALAEDSVIASTLSVRQRLEQHRRDPACATCHDIIDPIGFAFENFDAIGSWREKENEIPVSAAGGLPDGSQFEGVDGLEQALLQRPELFVHTLTEKLMTFALGRGVEYYDAPAIRRVVQETKANEHRFSELVLGIVKSVPFQMRITQ